MSSKSNFGFRMSELVSNPSVFDDIQKRLSQKSKEKKERKRALYLERKRQKELVETCNGTVDQQQDVVREG